MDIDNMEYNTTRNHLTMREYGRHVQKMVEHIMTIEEPERRQRNAQAVIELMGSPVLNIRFHIRCKISLPDSHQGNIEG